MNIMNNLQPGNEVQDAFDPTRWTIANRLKFCLKCLHNTSFFFFFLFFKKGSVKLSVQGIDCQ